MEDKIIEFKKRGKVRRKVYAKEAIALKKIRIFKKMKKADVGKVLGASERVIERLENGRTSLTIERTRQLLRHYRVSKAEFQGVHTGDIVYILYRRHGLHFSYTKRISDWLHSFTLIVKIS